LGGGNIKRAKKKLTMARMEVREKTIGQGGAFRKAEKKQTPNTQMLPQKEHENGGQRRKKEDDSRSRPGRGTSAMTTRREKITHQTTTHHPKKWVGERGSKGCPAHSGASTLFQSRSRSPRKDWSKREQERNREKKVEPKKERAVIPTWDSSLRKGVGG